MDVVVLTAGFVKSDGSTYAETGKKPEPDVLVCSSDFKDVSSADFDRVVDLMADDGKLVRVE
mgnify:CR=1 FL=1